MRLDTTLMSHQTLYNANDNDADVPVCVAGWSWSAAPVHGGVGGGTAFQNLHHPG